MSGLLLNENLPASLALIFKTKIGHVEHVSDVGLAGKPDSEIWDYAAGQGLSIATKDSDYLDFAITNPGPRVVLLAVGNMYLAELRQFVEGHLGIVADFLTGEDPFLVLRPPEEP